MATAGYAPRPSLPGGSSTVTLPNYPSLAIKLVGIRKTSTSVMAAAAAAPRSEPGLVKLVEPCPGKSSKDGAMALKVCRGSVKIIGGRMTEIPAITVTAPTAVIQDSPKKRRKAAQLRHAATSPRSPGEVENIVIPEVAPARRIEDSRACRVCPTGGGGGHNSPNARSTPELQSTKGRALITKTPRTQESYEKGSLERQRDDTLGNIKLPRPDNVPEIPTKAVQTVARPCRPPDLECHRRRLDTPAVYLDPPSDHVPQPEASTGLLRLIRKQLDKYSATSNPKATASSRIDSTSPGTLDGRLNKRDQAKNPGKLPQGKLKPPGSTKSKTERYLEILNAAKNKSPPSVSSSDGSHRSPMVKFLYSSEVNSALCRYVYRQEVQRGSISHSAPPPRRGPSKIRIMELPRIYDDLVFMTRSKGALLDALRRRSEDPLGPEAVKRRAWEAWQAWHERHGLSDEQSNLLPDTSAIPKETRPKGDPKTRRPLPPKSATTSSEVSKRAPLMKMSLQTLKKQQPVRLPASEVRASAE